MRSSKIGQLEKARRYAGERDRFHIESLHCSVRGDNSAHHVSLAHGTLQCDCGYFASQHNCSHTLALLQLLDELLPDEARGK